MSERGADMAAEAAAKLAGVWQPASLTGRETLIKALQSFAREDFAVRLPPFAEGLDRELVEAFNAAAATNERFVREARRLEERMQQVELEGGRLEKARAALAEKAEQLAQSSRYKSEFLASMSHELRTPLNCLLILAKLLSDNLEENLTPRQVDYAQTIYSAGNDLLALIDDILDLAKIESGTIILNIEAERFTDIRDYCLRTFRQVAQDKGLNFDVKLAPGLPAAIHTDGKRLQQVLKNLLSNAFKFTRQGSVTLQIAPPPINWVPADGLPGPWVTFAVSDTGIGITPDKQQLIFEAFQQADGTTSRDYGGTGLGLSICREMTRLLDGEIRLSSRVGEGSCFTFYLPLTHLADSETAPPLFGPAQEAGTPEPSQPREVGSEAPTPLGQQAYYGRKSRRSDEGMVLIAEGEPRLASVLLGMVRGLGCQGVIASNEGTVGVLLKELKPDAVLLGTRLADAEGWAVLDSLRRDPETRYLPVSLIHAGPAGYLCLEMPGLPEGAGGTQDGEDGWEAVGRRDIDALFSEDRLTETAWSEIEHRLLAGDADAADIVVSRPGAAHQYSGEAGAMLRSRRSLDDLLSATAHFLQQAVGSEVQERREGPLGRRRGGADLSGCKVLVVDDDVRNIYAITGALEQYGMTVVHAESGREGIDCLRANPDIRAVLMDIMMPEVGGYETIHLIRGMADFQSLPIIAVTAQAMRGDREKCLQAGASDYLSKPVNVEQLLSLLRAWVRPGS